MQQVCISPFSQFQTTVQTERGGLVLDTFETPTGKLMKCSAAHGIQDIKRNKLF